MSNIQKRLQKILEEKFDGNYSAMARCTGMTDTAVRKYIINGNPPNFKFLSALVNKKDIDANWLLKENDTKTTQINN